ncbi:MAG: hypothetical protein CM1200mP26_21130 [Acidimicrobiales bacterium]|nr:MAG: hypothetical protein CM1200mP26_21130 [Acidimicrobiales bacterium]
MTNEGLDDSVSRFSETWTEVGRACTDDEFHAKVGPLCGGAPTWRTASRVHPRFDPGQAKAG